MSDIADNLAQNVLWVPPGSVHAERVGPMIRRP
jgi:hypothetical protein